MNKRQAKKLEIRKKYIINDDGTQSYHGLQSYSEMKKAYKKWRQNLKLYREFMYETYMWVLGKTRAF